MQRVNVVFPLETLVRELDFRLALAVKYMEPHHRVFLGGSYSTFRLLSHLEGGLYVGKHVFQPWKNPHGPLAYDLAKARGMSVVHLSEEGAVFMGGDEYSRIDLDRQLDPHVVKGEDYIATWGDWQADHYRSKKPACAPNIRTTGHPRFDLYRTAYRAFYEDRVRDIQRRFGKFVLINTNWQFALHPLGQEYCFSHHEGYYPEDDEKRTWFVSLWSRVARTVPSYIELVHRMSIKRKDLNFVFRPHPSDDPALLKAAFQGVPNVHVIHEGVVAPWILASRVMVHDGCTTGMEGYLLGQPVVSYQPVPEVETDMWLTNLFGIRCTERDHAMETILAAADDPDKYAAIVQQTFIPEEGHALFANFRHESFPLLMDVMREAEKKTTKQGNGVEASMSRLVAEETKASAIERAKRLVRPLFKARARSAKMARVAYYGLRKDDVMPRLEIVQKIEGKKVNARFYSENLLELTLA
jgi:surface carbohydrate biosynthesis protein